MSIGRVMGSWAAEEKESVIVEGEEEEESNESEQILPSGRRP